MIRTLRNRLKFSDKEDRIAYDHMMSIVDKRPLDINVETISFCPLKCVFCCNRLYERDKTVMDLDLFENIVKQYAQIGGGGIGLGSMQSDVLTDPLLLERVSVLNKYEGLLIPSTTNPWLGAGKYSDDDLLKILRCFKHIGISVEGHDRDSYLKMGGIDGFKQIHEQLRRLNGLIKENQIDIDIRLGFRTPDKNKLYSSDFYKEVTEWFPVSDVKDRFFSWFGSIKQEDLPKGTKVIYKNNSLEKDNCIVPHSTLSIQANGKVIGCGCIDWLEKNVIGDVHTDSLTEIWNSPKAEAFRSAFEKGALPEICRECGLYTPVTEWRNKKFINYSPADGLYYNL